MEQGQYQPWRDTKPRSVEKAKRYSLCKSVIPSQRDKTSSCRCEELPKSLRKESHLDNFFYYYLGKITLAAGWGMDWLMRWREEAHWKWRVRVVGYFIILCQWEWQSAWIWYQVIVVQSRKYILGHFRRYNQNDVTIGWLWWVRKRINGNFITVRTGGQWCFSQSCTANVGEKENVKDKITHFFFQEGPIK